MKKFVYLAGPILDQTQGDANLWRVECHAALKEHNIVAISPLRCEPAHGYVYKETYDDDPCFGTARAIASKNLFDTMSCDMVLAYLPQVSVGTIIEIGWAHALGKPVILVTDDPKLMAHPVLDAAASWKLQTLTQGLDVCIGVLAGYTGGRNV